jgi:hypothetical protein
MPLGGEVARGLFGEELRALARRSKTVSQVLRASPPFQRLRHIFCNSRARKARRPLPRGIERPKNDFKLLTG